MFYNFLPKFDCLKDELYKCIIQSCLTHFIDDIGMCRSIESAKMSFLKIAVLSVLLATCLASRSLVRVNEPFGGSEFGEELSGKVNPVAIPGFKYFDNDPINSLDVSSVLYKYYFS